MMMQRGMFSGLSVSSWLHRWLKTRWSLARRCKAAPCPVALRSMKYERPLLQRKTSRFNVGYVTVCAVVASLCCCSSSKCWRLLIRQILWSLKATVIPRAAASKERARLCYRCSRNVVCVFRIVAVARKKSIEVFHMTSCTLCLRVLVGRGSEIGFKEPKKAPKPEMWSKLSTGVVGALWIWIIFPVTVINLR